GGQKQQRDERNEGGDHEHVAMGEIHHADDAEHHRVADGDETVDRAERDAVDELLGEDFHARAPGAEASPTIRQALKLYQGAARPATAANLHPRALWAEGAAWGDSGRNQKFRVRVVGPITGRRMKMGRYLLLWLLGVPIPILLLILAFGGLPLAARCAGL